MNSSSQQFFEHLHSPESNIYPNSKIHINIEIKYSIHDHKQQFLKNMIFKNTLLILYYLFLVPKDMPISSNSISYFKTDHKLNMKTHIYYPSIGKTEVGRLLQVQSQTTLCSESKAVRHTWEFSISKRKKN